MFLLCCWNLFPSPTYIARWFCSPEWQCFRLRRYSGGILCPREFFPVFSCLGFNLTWTWTKLERSRSLRAGYIVNGECLTRIRISHGVVSATSKYPGCDSYFSLPLALSPPKIVYRVYDLECTSHRYATFECSVLSHLELSSFQLLGALLNFLSSLWNLAIDTSNYSHPSRCVQLWNLICVICFLRLLFSCGFGSPRILSLKNGFLFDSAL